jgi:hypothetical protein
MQRRREKQLVESQALKPERQQPGRKTVFLANNEPRNSAPPMDAPGILGFAELLPGRRPRERPASSLPFTSNPQQAPVPYPST